MLFDITPPIAPATARSSVPPPAALSPVAERHCRRHPRSRRRGPRRCSATGEPDGQESSPAAATAPVAESRGRASDWRGKRGGRIMIGVFPADRWLRSRRGKGSAMIAPHRGLVQRLEGEHARGGRCRPQPERSSPPALPRMAERRPAQEGGAGADVPEILYRRRRRPLTAAERPCPLAVVLAMFPRWSMRNVAGMPVTP